MINENVTNVLQQINGITNTVILKHPTTIVNSPAGDIIAKINIAKLDADAFADIGIYNLSEFLNTFKLFDEDRNVEITDKNISITSGNTALNYISTNIALLDDYNKAPDVFTKTEEVPTVAEFAISVDDIKKIKQASGVFKDLTEISLQSQDGNMTISLGAGTSFNAKSNYYNVQKSAQTSKEFTVAIPVENFNAIPQGDYTVLIKYNSARDAFRVIFESADIDMKILLAVKK